MFANSIPGQKGRTVGATAAAMGGGIVVAAPAIVLAVLSLVISPGWGWAALLVGPLCGIAAVLLLSSLTASTYLGRIPEILATVAIGDRS
jgi:ABC-2 type transport system permease protein